MTIGTWALVGVLGGAGAVARFIVDGLVDERAGFGGGFGGEFPWGTFVVNLTGAALLGILVGAAVTGNALVLAGTATLGSYTTLSTLMLETHRLGQDDQLPIAAANLLGSMFVGFAAVALGHAIGAAL
jgi:fluoride exporter